MIYLILWWSSFHKVKRDFYKLHLWLSGSGCQMPSDVLLGGWHTGVFPYLGDKTN